MTQMTTTPEDLKQFENTIGNIHTKTKELFVKLERFEKQIKGGYCPNCDKLLANLKAIYAELETVKANRNRAVKENIPLFIPGTPGGTISLNVKYTFPYTFPVIAGSPIKVFECEYDWSGKIKGYLLSSVKMEKIK